MRSVETFRSSVRCRREISRNGGGFMPKVRRIESIDFWRGLALLIIFVDHVPGNPLASITPRNFGFSDSSRSFYFPLRLGPRLCLLAEIRCRRNGRVVGRCLRRTATDLRRAYRDLRDRTCHFRKWLSSDRPCPSFSSDDGRATVFRQSAPQYDRTCDAWLPVRLCEHPAGLCRTPAHGTAFVGPAAPGHLARACGFGRSLCRRANAACICRAGRARTLGSSTPLPGNSCSRSVSSRASSRATGTSRDRKLRLPSRQHRALRFLRGNERLRLSARSFSKFRGRDRSPTSNCSASPGSAISCLLPIFCYSFNAASLLLRIPGAHEVSRLGRNSLSIFTAGTILCAFGQLILDFCDDY